MPDQPDQPDLDPSVAGRLDDDALAAAASLRLIREQQERARAGTEPDSRLLCAVWGLAWIVGYGLLWFSADRRGDIPAAWAFIAFGLCLVGAMVTTIVHSVSRTLGTRGTSTRTGNMYGFSWALGFAAYGVVIGGIAESGASDEVIAQAANALACMVVGLLYLGGGACFDSRGLYLLGVWILVVAAGATFAGLPETYLVMSLAGGGGFLVLALVEHLLLRRRRTVHEVVGRG